MMWKTSICAPREPLPDTGGKADLDRPQKGSFIYGGSMISTCFSIPHTSRKKGAGFDSPTLIPPNILLASNWAPI